MKTSTIIAGASALVLAGVGAYLYFSGKKATPPSSTTPTNPTTTNSTPSTSTSGSTSVANNSLGLSTTSSSSADEQKNYLEAKDLAKILLLNLSRTFNDEYKILMTKYGYQVKNLIFMMNTTNGVATKIITKRINALGYKLLPNYDIEKM